MNTYIVVATFKPNTNMQEVFAVVAAERAQVVVLRSAGQLGFVHLSLARGTVFGRDASQRGGQQPAHVALVGH